MGRRGELGRSLRRGLAALGLALASQLAPTRATGRLARTDARAKVVAAALLIIGVTLLHTLAAVAVAAVLAILIALAAGLRGRRLAPLWLGVPLFTLALALPATLNLVTPGQPLCVLLTPASRHLGPWLLPAQITLTGPGLIVASRFVLRTVACVALALTLTATTEPAALIIALRRLGLPKVFGMVLTMMQRYLVVILRSAQDLHRARLSRALGPQTARQGQRWAAAGIGLLLLSSLRLAEGVHQAMLARGYDGDIQALAAPRLARREALLVVTSALFAVALVALDRALQ